MLRAVSEQARLHPSPVQAGSEQLALPWTLRGLGHPPGSSSVIKHLLNGHGVIYFVISLISLSKTDLVSKLH